MDGLSNEWEVQSEGGTGARTAFHANLAGMFLDNPVGNGKAEASAARLAFARRSLGSEEGIINALNVLGCDARSRIGDAYADALAIQRRHAQRAATRHRVFRIQKQVQ